MVRITVARKIRIHDGDDDKEESMPPYIVAVRGLQARGILGPFPEPSGTARASGVCCWQARAMALTRPWPPTAWSSSSGNPSETDKK